MSYERKFCVLLEYNLTNLKPLLRLEAEMCLLSKIRSILSKMAYIQSEDKKFHCNMIFE